MKEVTDIWLYLKQCFKIILNFLNFYLLDKCVSTKRADLNRILAKMNLQVDNPVN